MNTSINFGGVYNWWYLGMGTCFHLVFVLNSLHATKSLRQVLFYLGRFAFKKGIKQHNETIFFILHANGASEIFEIEFLKRWEGGTKFSFENECDSNADSLKQKKKKKTMAINWLIVFDRSYPTFTQQHFDFSSDLRV